MNVQASEWTTEEREKKKHEQGERAKIATNFFLHFAQLIYNVDDIFLYFSAFILY